MTIQSDTRDHQTAYDRPLDEAVSVPEQHATGRSRNRRWLLGTGAAVAMAAAGAALAVTLWPASSSITPARPGTPASTSAPANPAVPSRPAVNPAVPSRPAVNPAVPSRPAANPAVPGTPNGAPGSQNGSGSAGS